MNPAKPLTENDVVDSVCAYLEATGYRIVARADAQERGVDVIARRKLGSGRFARGACRG